MDWPDDSFIRLKDCLRFWSKSKRVFAKNLESELYDKADGLPMDDWCTNGGSVCPTRGIWISDFVLRERTPTEATGQFRAKFTESLSSGCRDIDWREDHDEVVDFSLNRESGKLRISVPPYREYDPEEF